LPEVPALALLRRRQGPVREHQGDALVAQYVLKLQRVQRIIGTCQPVAARDEDVGNLAVLGHLLDQGAQARALQDVAGDAVVQEQVAAVGAVVADHGGDRLGGAVEAQPQLLGLTARPRDVLREAHLVLAAAVPRVEQRPAGLLSLGHGLPPLAGSGWAWSWRCAHRKSANAPTRASASASPSSRSAPSRGRPF